MQNGSGSYIRRGFLGFFFLVHIVEKKRRLWVRGVVRRWWWVRRRGET